MYIGYFSILLNGYQLFNFSVVNAEFNQCIKAI